jgi:hypothetical protein
VERKTAPFDLMVALMETSKGLTGTLFYKIDVFSKKTIDIMARCFVTILDQVAADHDIHLLDISLGDGEDQPWSIDQIDEDESFNF